MQKIIIDTDPGVDDAIAILYGIKSKKIKVEAITTVCGNSTLKNTTDNALRVLQELRREDIPVCMGAEAPLVKDLRVAQSHGIDGLSGYDTEVKYKPSKISAVDKILEIVRKNPNEITILAIAPLTNIAKAIQKDSKTMKLVKELIIMGGAINTFGNMSPVSEFNIFVDPDAAKVVFDFDVPKVLVPLDACRQVIITPKDLDAFPDSEAGRLAKRILTRYVDWHVKEEKMTGGVMYDPLAMGILLDSTYTDRIKMNVRVETNGEFTNGVTVADLRNERRDKNINCEVCMKVDSKRFLKDFLRILLI